MTAALRTFLFAGAIAAGTWAGGWTAVPLVAFLWGAWRREQSGSSLGAGLGAAIGWGILLGVAALGGPVLTVAARVGGLAGVPGAVIVGVTLAFAFGLAWSAAEIGRTMMLVAVRRTAADEE